MMKYALIVGGVFALIGVALSIVLTFATPGELFVRGFVVLPALVLPVVGALLGGFVGLISNPDRSQDYPDGSRQYPNDPGEYRRPQREYLQFRGRYQDQAERINRQIAEAARFPKSEESSIKANDAENLGDNVSK
jgi:hypothetical protein